MGISYNISEWRLFIDSSKRSLKAKLLFNRNQVASVPVGHSVQMDENYNNMEYLLTALKYKDHNWKICGDLKVVSMVLGLQGGYTNKQIFREIKEPSNVGIDFCNLLTILNTWLDSDIIALTFDSKAVIT
ncbi:uncharacterized protein LOC121870899 [Homarus americanus]|uniref:uncharacterized protein LOC121870899 n=1 Tax=Homarus americanus TaxID=6706 RepID=UPI001C47535E|nr:uncharacterized protein LOC121870899 [Homarus americanus]